MTIELTPNKFLTEARALSISDEELVDELNWPYSAEARNDPESAAPLRSLTITWDDPLSGLPQRERMSGREYLELIQHGEAPPPPIAQLMDIDLVEVGEGRTTFEGHPA